MPREDRFLFFEPVESKTRTHYGPVGSGWRTAGWRGGQSWVGRDAVGSIRPGDNPLLPSCESGTLSWTTFRKQEQMKSHVNRPVESKTRTYHGRFVSARRTAGRRDVAGPGRTGRRQDGWPPVALQSIVASYPECLLQARTKDILCNPMEEQTPRLTTGSSAGPRALFVLAADQLSTPIRLRKPFSCRACPGM